MRSWLPMFIILAVLVSAMDAVAQRERPAQDPREALGLDRAGSASSIPSGDVKDSNIHWFGFYDPGTGTAVPDETWTFDHGAADPFEGWVSEDMTGNDFTAWKRITEASWAGHDNAIPAPLLQGTASYWVGFFEDRADSLCWRNGLGYGINWRQQRLISPSFTYDGSDSVRISFLYFSDCEPDYDGTTVLVSFPALDTTVTLDFFEGPHGSPSAPTPFSETVDVETLSGGQPTPFALVFEFNSDAGWCDEDGQFNSTYGAFGVDSITIANNVVEGDQFFDFETGDEGFTTSFFPGLGDFSAINPVGPYGLTEPDCNLDGNVVSFHDESWGHPDDSTINIVSPSVPLSDIGSGPFTIFVELDVYEDLRIHAQCDFWRYGWTYYPYDCPPGGSMWSPPQMTTQYEYTGSTEEPGCFQLRRFGRHVEEQVTYIPADAESCRVVLQFLNACDFYNGTFCSCAIPSNFSPLFDNIRIGVVEADSVLFVPSGDFPTIQAAIDSSVSGNQILLADGTYAGDGNRDLDFQGKDITVRSESGDPSACIIDCEGTPGEPHRGVFFDGEGPLAVLKDLTITGGYGDYGGAILCDGSSPTMEGCVFTGNSSQYDGGAVFCRSTSTPTLTDCVLSNNAAGDDGGGFGCRDTSDVQLTGCTLIDNTASDDGGAVYCYNATPTFTNCTIAGNHAPDQGAALGLVGSSAILNNTIIALNTDNAPFYCSGSSPVLSCCDVYGNAGGDWTGCIGGQETLRDNLSANPLFCDADNGNYLLRSCSPCLNAPGCGQVGSLGFGDCPSRTWYVPADAPTIQAAIDLACSGDTVRVAAGTYTGDGNRDIDFGGKGILLRGDSYQPSLYVLDVGGSVGDPHRGFIFQSEEDSTTVVRALTITGGYATQGGAVNCDHSSPELSSLVFLSNTASDDGGAVYCTNYSSPRVLNCEAVDNTAGDNGGGFYFNSHCQPFIHYCNVFGNSATDAGGGIGYANYSSGDGRGCDIAHNQAGVGGSGVFCHGNCYPDFESFTISHNSSSGGSVLARQNSLIDLTHTNITFDATGPAVACETGGAVSLNCSNVYGNAGGDYVGCIAGEEGADNNFSADPIYCNPDSNDFWVRSDSPCLMHPGCGAIGGIGIGCYAWRTWLVCPDGSGDFTTIQEAVSAAAEQDTIELCDGIYTGDGNRDISTWKKLTIRSQTGDPTACIIDVQGTAEEYHRAFTISSFGDVDFEGITFTGGYSDYSGGAIKCQDSDVVFRDCMFTDNNCVSTGGAVYATTSYSGSTIFYDCIFMNNTAEYGGAVVCMGNGYFHGCVMSGNTADRGGAIYAAYGGGSYFDCTIVDNHGTEGSAAYLSYQADLYFNRTILAFNTGSQTVECGEPSADARLYCSDVFGNSGGDWVGCIADQAGNIGNISEDPRFCDLTGGDYTLRCTSPCLDPAEPSCDGMGALGEGDCPRTWYVPSQCPTIQAGIDSACSGGTVLIADGTYAGEGNRDVDFGGKALTVRSESGNADLCVIDCQADSLNPHRGFIFQNGEDSTSVLQDVTITNAYHGLYGAGILCYGSSPTITGCIVRDNATARGPGTHGAGICCNSSASPEITDCLISDNSADYGGGISCLGSSSPDIARCTIAGNAAGAGAALLCSDVSNPIITRSILAMNAEGEAILCWTYSNPALACSDVFGNAGGDWVGCIAGQDTLDNNFSADPIFCGAEDGNYHLRICSPCLNVDGCGQVGALGSGGCERVWHVPAEALTIQAGIDSAACGDTVVVACGTYNEHSIILKGGIVLRSETGTYDCVTIDAEQQGTIFYAQDFSDITEIVGLTLTGGLFYSGGAMFTDDCTLRISNCHFTDNRGQSLGGNSYAAGIFAGGDVHLSGCVFSNNIAEGAGHGGAIYAAGDTMSVVNCTVYGNAAQSGEGAGLFVTGSASVYLGNSIIAFSSEGEAVYCTGTGTDPTVNCCDIFGNAGGDWVGCIAGQDSLHHNLSVDPLFCDAGGGDFTLYSHSPCEAANAWSCGTIGAKGVGCYLHNIVHVPADELTIQAGLNTAFAGDTVIVACGTYHEHSIWMKPGVYLRSETGLPDCVTIEADSLGRVMFCFNADSTTCIEGFTFTEGWPDDSFGGGGIWCSGASPRLIRLAFLRNWGSGGGGLRCEFDSSPSLFECTFTENSSQLMGSGGGMSCYDHSSPTLTDCGFFNNVADGLGYGGGMSVIGYCSPTLTRCTFSGNSALFDGAGGGFASYGSSPILIDCDFTENVSAHGGGVYSSRDSSFTIIDTEFHDNASGCGDLGGGGGLLSSFSVLEVSGCSFTGNFINSGNCTSGGGGGAYADFGSAVFTDCVFRQNSADLTQGGEGGGGGVLCGRDASATFMNCIFDRNSCDIEYGDYWGGGGLYCASRSTAALTGCTFSGNSAASNLYGEHKGGAIYLDTNVSISLDHTILAFSEYGEAIFCNYAPSDTVTITCSDIYGNAGGDWVGCISGLYGANGNFSEDPLFCGRFGGDLTLGMQSPCAPDNAPPGCGLIGADSVACDITGVAESRDVRLPTAFYLGPAVPNPFNPVTEISYGIPMSDGASRVRMNVYDVLGRNVRTLVDADQAPGIYRVTWDGCDDRGVAVASGVYFYRVTWNGKSETNRMVLLK